MLYLGDLEMRHCARLISDLPMGEVQSFKDFGKIANKITADDTAILYNYRYRKLLNTIGDKCPNVFPNVQASNFCANRAESIQLLDTITKFPIKRTYYPATNGHHRVNLKKGHVYKIGDLQQGRGKFNGNQQDTLDVYRNSYIEEEFLVGKSMRVLWIYPNNIFLIEHVNSSNWIANVDPDEEIVHDMFDVSYELKSTIITDALYMIHHLRTMNMLSLTWGFDYVVGHRTGLLEANDMCGLPIHQGIDQAFLEACKMVHSKGFNRAFSI